MPNEPGRPERPGPGPGPRGHAESGGDAGGASGGVALPRAGAAQALDPRGPGFAAVAGERAARWFAVNCNRCRAEEGCGLRARLLAAVAARRALDRPSCERLGVPPDGRFGDWTCREYRPSGSATPAGSPGLPG